MIGMSDLSGTEEVELRVKHAEVITRNATAELSCLAVG